MIFYVLLSSVLVHSFQIPFIDQTVLIPKSTPKTTIITNQTCSQCLCQFNSAHIGLNCFPNDTCQFFQSYPRVYTMENLLAARHYFLQHIFPNSSECCMANDSYLFGQLSVASPIFVTVTKPRCLIIDNDGYLVTFSQTTNNIIRLNPTNLSIINQPISPIFPNWPNSIVYYDNAYYVGFDRYVLVLHTSNFSILANITSPSLDLSRDITLLHDGQIMVVLSTGNNRILFFNRTNNISKNYIYVNQQLVACQSPHGLWHVNDSYFYITSWATNSIYSYSATNTSFIWTEQFFINASSITSSQNGNHVTVDNCNRYWFSLGSNGIRIFNEQRILIKNFTGITSFVFDILITDEYVMYISDSIANKIFRIDLNTTCL